MLGARPEAMSCCLCLCEGRPRKAGDAFARTWLLATFGLSAALSAEGPKVGV